MKQGVVALILIVFLLGIGIVFSQNNDNTENDGKVDEEVEEKLKQEDEVSVIVILEDDDNILNEYSVSSLNEMDEFEKKKVMIEKQQEKVLSDLDLKQENTLGILADKDFDFKLEKSENGKSSKC